MLRYESSTTILEKQMSTPMAIHQGRSNSVDNAPKSDSAVVDISDSAAEGLSRSRSAPSLAALADQSTFACVHSPNKDSVWRWGQPAFLMWERRDMSVSEIRIVLRRKGASTSTIVADHVENNGLFVYMSVPPGMTPSNDYYVCIMSMDGANAVDGECFSITP
ncbi:Aste57867_21809 [Aphanomyces stellatus]|uniref:Aste57867_21809 protein n=1 Tax=Aphanomyces stellatus TaxID=120398 RepID=A0A485LJ68_9STRA|nr:hypothetical protein As57867_021740 [Aphanomyces stellatus]VFT98478.1 Aste57867_21809 [Aphanomyces stellatus]